MLDYIKQLNVAGETFPATFSFNALEKIQDEYGSLSNWIEKIENTTEDESEISIATIKKSLRLAINDGIEIENYKNDNKKEKVTDMEINLIMMEIGLRTSVNFIKEVITKTFPIVVK